jgi:hypothetical protein
MNWIIFFTSYGNSKKIAEMLLKIELSSKRDMKLENGELISDSDLNKIQSNELPALVYLVSPIRRHSLWKKAQKWLKMLAIEIRKREDVSSKQRDTKGSTAITASSNIWKPRLAIVFTHRFPEDDYKIELSIKKFLRKTSISKKKDNTAGSSLADITPASPFGVLVEKITGPVEPGAMDKLKQWIKENDSVLHASPSSMPPATESRLHAEPAQQAAEKK